jgi:hypothetical protein
MRIARYVPQGLNVLFKAVADIRIHSRTANSKHES